MTLSISEAVAALALLATVVFGYLGARPARPLTAPRLMPWRLMMAVAFVLAVAAGVHIVALLRGS